jgi:hypothetical protein
MSAEGNRGIASIFGFLGAALLLLDSLILLVSGVFYLAVSHGARALGAFDSGIVLFVIGLVVAFFSVIGRRHTRDNSVVAGIVLVILALAGWLVLGLTSGVLALLGTVFVLIAGVVFLVASM